MVEFCCQLWAVDFISDISSKISDPARSRSLPASTSVGESAPGTTLSGWRRRRSPGALNSSVASQPSESDCGWGPSTPPSRPPPSIKGPSSRSRAMLESPYPPQAPTLLPISLALTSPRSCSYRKLMTGRPPPPWTCSSPRRLCPTLRRFVVADAGLPWSGKEEMKREKEDALYFFARMREERRKKRKGRMVKDENTPTNYNRQISGVRLVIKIKELY